MKLYYPSCIHHQPDRPAFAMDQGIRLITRRRPVYRRAPQARVRQDQPQLLVSGVETARPADRSSAILKYLPTRRTRPPIPRTCRPRRRCTNEWTGSIPNIYKDFAYGVIYPQTFRTTSGGRLPCQSEPWMGQAEDPGLAEDPR